MLDQLRLLVVDDMKDVAESLALAVASDGLKVLTAFSGEEALRMVGEHLPHIVLFDVAMPGMDGSELSRILRERWGGEIVLIAMTGKDEGDPRVLKALQRSDHYFRKPVDLAQLRIVLSTGPSAA